MLRLYLDQPIVANDLLVLPPETARHVQVLRLQPGEEVTLFNGQGGEWRAEIVTMGRRDVTVRALQHLQLDRERPGHVVLAVGMPANERFDWLVEKATELGVHEIQPLMCERSVLRLSGERAQRKTVHWQGIANAAAEQSGRTAVPLIHPPTPFIQFLAAAPAGLPGERLMLSLQPHAQPLPAAAAAVRRVVLSGPEGGLAPAEEALALERGFQAVTLGRRILRAETAPLVCLSRWDG